MIKPQLSSAPEGPITYPKIASTKLDGIRAITSAGRVLSRSLKPIPNLHIQKVLSPYAGLDGELIVGDPNSPDVYRTTNSAVMSISGDPEFTYYVFDCPEVPGTFDERLEYLRGLQLPSFIKVLEQQRLDSDEELERLYQRSLSCGFEGLILRNPLSLYKQGRCTAKSQDSLKLKPQEDFDAVVIGTFEAMENKNEVYTNELGNSARSSHACNKVGKGMLGGFVVKDLATGIEFRCSPGVLTHEERLELFDQVLVGRVIKYRCLLIGVKDKPRHPRFIGWRSLEDMEPK